MSPEQARIRAAVDDRTPGSWLHPASPSDWAVRVLTIAVVVLLAASYVLWDAVQGVRRAQDEARMRGCAILAEQGVGPDRLDGLGCR